ncbi:MAG: cytochrome d ubiquinol oxidase subunit II, partial [Acetobacter sp.]|nr:cytochrome d ubiquinol oxidase subunit II [Acetobacter sp.]
YLINPFAILCGLMSVALSIFQGGVMLMMRGEDPIYTRAKNCAQWGAIIAAVLFIIGGVWVRALRGYVLDSGNPDMASVPMTGQHVTREVGAWMHNYAAHPILWIFPLLGIVSMFVGAALARGNSPHVAWWFGALAWIGTIGTVGASMFPFFMPSTTNPDQSMTIWNSCSSEYTLLCMLIVALIFVPIILWYTSWCYYLMGGKVKAPSITDSHSY